MIELGAAPVSGRISTRRRYMVMPNRYGYVASYMFNGNTPYVGRLERGKFPMALPRTYQLFGIIFCAIAMHYLLGISFRQPFGDSFFFFLAVHGACICAFQTCLICFCIAYNYTRPMEVFSIPRVGPTRLTQRLAREQMSYPVTCAYSTFSGSI